METPFEKRYEAWAMTREKSVAGYLFNLMSVYELEHTGVKENY